MSVENSVYDHTAPVDGLAWLRSKRQMPKTATIPAEKPVVRHLALVPPREQRAPRPIISIFPQPFEADIPTDITVESVPTLLDLTGNEPFILLQTARGYKAREINRQLNTGGISLKSIQKKYGVDNATQMVSLAIKHGVLTPDMFKNKHGEEDFDFSIVENLDDTQRNVLAELTNTHEPNSNEEIGKRLQEPMKPQEVSNVLGDLYSEYNLQTRPKAAAFYLLAERAGLIPGTSTELIDHAFATKVAETHKQQSNKSIPVKTLIESRSSLKPHFNEEEQQEIQPLTKTEKIILMYMAKGLSINAIAQELQRSISTIGTHRERIFKKYNVKKGIHALIVGLHQNDIDINTYEQEFDFSNIGKVTNAQIKILKELTNIQDPLKGPNLEKAIGEKIYYAENSVKTYIRYLLRDQHLRNRNEAAMFYLVAVKKGLLPSAA